MGVSTPVMMGHRVPIKTASKKMFNRILNKSLNLSEIFFLGSRGFLFSNPRTIMNKSPRKAIKIGMHNFDDA
ncbi:hypothetical protein AN2V17_11770 [Vallitalea sp. AN17-2]|uniref:Uncharacterized protein n=1 Tax=Vallitalea maricola TaxID=3074433 RepID=A0ACB5UG84_9FIRM|nr:hypothetical protein AN2V17_11770 [Vallitalea sp. AN17-2]